MNPQLPVSKLKITRIIYSSKLNFVILRDFDSLENLRPNLE